MTCTYCGKDIDNGSKFCPACGQRLVSTEEKISGAAAEALSGAPAKAPAEASAEPEAAERPAPTPTPTEEKPFVRELPEQRVVTGSPSYYQMCHSSGDAAGAARFSGAGQPVQPGQPVSGDPLRNRQTGTVWRADAPAGDSAAVQRSGKKKSARKPAKEKEFFGKGAFIFCLIVIALLAGAAGAFGYLYFSLLGAI